MGTIFLVIVTHVRVCHRVKRAPHWGVQSRFRVIYICRSVCRSVCLSCLKCEHTKTENHKKQRPATLKRLKRGDDIQWVGEKPKTGRRSKKSTTGECCSYQTAQFGHGERQRKKIKTGEDCSYRTMLALTKGVGVVLSLNPF